MRDILRTIDSLPALALAGAFALLGALGAPASRAGAVSAISDDASALQHAPASPPDASTLHQAPASLPDAAALLDAYVAAIGGQTLRDMLYNRVATGSVELVGLGIKGTLTETSQQPNASRLVMELEGLGRIEGGTDGATAWEFDSIQGARLLEGGERSIALRTAALANGVEWRRLYAAVAYAGLDTLDGKACHKVALTAADGASETWFLDAADHLLKKTATVVETIMGQLPVETTLEDYRPVDGLLLPHVSVQSLLAQKIRIVYGDIRHNVDLGEEAFRVPAEVRDLLQAPARPAPPPENLAPAPEHRTPAPEHPAPAPQLSAPDPPSQGKAPDAP